MMLRRLKGRFGITAPQVSVRTHVPWYLRMAGVVLAIVLSLALAAWAYDAGRRVAGFDRSETSFVVDELRKTNAALEEEVARLRSLLTASESSLQIEQAAQKLLNEKNSLLAEESGRLKEDLAVLERLAKVEGSTNDEVSLDRLTVSLESPGKYRFNFFIALQGSRRGKESRFRLQVIASPRQGTVGDKMMFPKRGSQTQDDSQYDIVLRNFRRIEGRFDIPPPYAVGAVEIKIFEADILRASKSVTL